MPTRRKSLKKPRTQAFHRQNGKCCYCGCAMWNDSPAELSGLSQGQVKQFRCTGEHLRPHKDGGDSSSSNIAAACLICNRRRHQRKDDLSPEQYRDLVQRRLAAGRWHA